MVKFISHRGNTDGPNPEKENRPEYILEAVALGHDVEIDVWVKDKEIFLGHDEPKYKINFSFIESIKNVAWIHCKNAEALYYFSSYHKDINFFWHQGDDFTLTSSGNIWTLKDKDLTPISVAVDLNLDNSYDFSKSSVGIYGVCTDYCGTKTQDLKDIKVKNVIDEIDERSRDSFWEKPNTYYFKEDSIEKAVIGSDGKYFPLNDFELSQLFFNTIAEPRHLSPNEQWVHSKDIGGYTLNKHGYRSPEFDSGPDVIITGCSLTYGLGIKEEGIWGPLVCNELGFSYVNLALPGTGVNFAVNNLFSYFKEHGHPKAIICLFPDFYRLRIPVNKKLLLSKEHSVFLTKDDQLNNFYLANSAVSPIHAKYEKISKPPYIIEEMLPLDVPFYYSLISIQILEQYCKASGIELVWATWSGVTEESIVRMKNKELKHDYYESMISLLDDYWMDDPDNMRMYACQEDNKEIICHEYLKEIDGDMFDLALDRENGYFGSHWGTHRHRHIADRFKKELEKKIGNKNKVRKYIY